MKTIEIGTAKSYNVLFGNGILNSSGELIKRALSPKTAVVVTDDNVDSFYGETVCSSIASEGIKVSKFVFPHGESSKNAETYIKLLNFLSKSDMTRTDAVIALGGGVTGDLAGFAAATFMRGVGLVQIPTSLLAMVDSSVGGKTAIDLDAGKNLCGAFYQPNLVICDTKCLNTLPKEYFLDGCAEIIKYGCFGNSELLDHLEKYGLDFDRDYVIPTCICMKRDVVLNDEFDRGGRQILNFGHTAGHAIEKLGDFKLSHGRCVAMGMVIIAEAARAAGYCSAQCADEIQSLVQSFGFNMHHGYSPDKLLPCFANDKKRTGSSITAVIPVNRGKCELKKMSTEEFSEFISIGVTEWK